MQEYIKIQQFGFSEMYEWYNLPNNELRFAKFVTFSKEDPTKIELYGKSADDKILGITTINSIIDSDDPDEWKFKYMITDVGDILLQKEKLAVGTKQYDENLELAYIRTYPWEHLIKIQNKGFDATKDYVKRSNREEWIRVNLLGKCIVRDNGKCVPGGYCTPYVGKLKDQYGFAVPAKDTDTNKYYVMGRISDNAILIVNK